MENDIPDKIPGMTLMPIRLDQLKDCLMRIADSTVNDFPKEPSSSAVMIEILDIIKRSYPDDWPAASMFIIAFILNSLIKRFASETVIDLDIDLDDD